MDLSHTVLQPASIVNSVKEVSAKGRAFEAQTEQGKKLMDKCLEFESLLFNCMIKNMRDTIQKSGLIDGGNAEEIYTSMLDQEYAKALSKSTRSTLAESMYEQLKPKEQQQGKPDKMKTKELNVIPRNRENSSNAELTHYKSIQGGGRVEKVK